jgi:predicted dehydrogenase
MSKTGYKPALAFFTAVNSIFSLARPCGCLRLGVIPIMRSTRRRFLGTAASAVAAFTIVPRHVLGGPRFVPPSEKVNVALIGAGGQGRTNARALFKQRDAQIMAVADPHDEFSLEQFYYRGMAGRKPVRAEIEQHYARLTPNHRVAEYEDFRVMIEKEKSIDAVLCATPDHLHAAVSVMAMRAGKHVYCEKPLTNNIHEARLVARVAKETGVATQLGNQGHSSEGIRETCEWIWDGAIGQVREVHAWVGHGRWNPGLAGKPAMGEPVPAGLNWDLWLGPRPERPFHPVYVPVAWRDFWAFGCGTLGDFGCHDLDAACWALDLGAPATVEGGGAGPMDAEIAPHAELCYWQFDARGEKPPARVTWYGGGIKPPIPESWPEEAPWPDRGVLFAGHKGLLFCGGAGGKPRLLPESRDRDYRRPAPTLARSKGHHRDWLDACKGGQAASSNFEYGAGLTEIVLVGVAGVRLGRKFAWDASKMEARGIPEAEAIFKPAFRAGWELA